MKKKSFQIDIEFHDDVASQHVIKYLEDAVARWGGSFDPEDPLFPDNFKSIKVSKLKSAHER